MGVNRPMRPPIAALVLLAPMAMLAGPTSRALAASVLVCEPQWQVRCHSEGCDDRTGPPPQFRIHLDREGKRYMRCDPKGCDAFPMSETPSGIFVLFEVPSRGVALKLGPGDSFIEWASLGPMLFLKAGTCRSVP